MILVTGAGGFVGRAVCSSLVARGEAVLATDRAFGATPPCAAATGDLMDTAFVATLFEGPPFDAVVHLGGLLGSASRQRPREAVRVNVEASLALLDLARRAGVGKFVYGSSVSAYGSKPAAIHGEVDETEPASPDDVYGLGKRCVEVVGETLRGQARLEFIALRLSIVVGAGATATASPWRSAIFEALRSSAPATIELPYDPEERFPLVHVEDVAAMIDRVVAAAPATHAIYNLPAESWRGSELRDLVRGLNERIELVCGRTAVAGFPQAVSGKRFAGEFAFTAVPLRQRLAEAAASSAR